MSDFGFDDEEMDQMFAEQHQQGAPAVMQPQIEPVPLYSMQLAQAPASPQAPGMQLDPQGAATTPDGLLKKKWGPLPVWAWGLIGTGVLGTGYFVYRSMKKVTPNGSGDEDDAPPKLGQIVSKMLGSGEPSGGSSSSGWEPSRSRFAEQLERYYQRKGQSQHVKVWHDAEEAKEQGGLKFVSPLVNVQVKHGTVKLDQPLTRFCRREGLNPTAHPDGSIGLYPHASKRGKEWEEYVDALRDDGQQI